MNIKIVGKKLKVLRIKNELEVEQVKNILQKRNIKYSISTIYKWEEGNVLPNIEIIDILCNIYGCSVSYLLEDDIVESKNLTACEIFLLEQFRYNSDFRKIADLIYKLFLKDAKQHKKPNRNTI